MLKFIPALWILLFGLPVIATAAPVKVVHERTVIVHKVHQDVRRLPVARPYDRWNDGRIRQMRHAQQKRIDQGLRSGRLTKQEGRRLRAEQTRILQLERRYKADGYLSRKERVHLEQLLNRAGQHIYNALRDGRHKRRS